MAARVQWVRWPVILLGVAGAVILALAYLQAAWLLMALGALMLAANVMMMSALKHQSRRPVSSRVRRRHGK